MKKYLFLIIFSSSSFILTAQVWTQKANYGIASLGVAGFSVNNKIYVGTGQTTSGLTNVFWEYTPGAGTMGGTWTQMANFPGNIRSSAAGFAIGSVGYIGAGSGGGTKYNDFYEYTPPPTNSWTQKANFGGIARNSPVAFAINGKGYMGLGSAISTNAPLADLWEYTPGAGVMGGSWTRMTDIPGSARWAAASFVLNGRGYVATGYDGGTTLPDMWEYDPSGDSWIQKTNYGGGSVNWASGFSICDKGYVGCGWTSAHRADFWEYTWAAGAMGGSWTKISDYPGGGTLHPFTAVVDNRAYVGIGNNQATTESVQFWEYNAGCVWPLPVELLSFSAKWQDESYNAAIIEWETANEYNNDYFEIERSIDAIHFTSIMQVDGLNNLTTTNYTELDTDPYKEDVSYYRLKQVDYDGTFSYSQIDALNVPDGLEIINLYPNPVQDILNFSLLSSLETEINIKITNALGQSILEHSKTINQGINQINIDLPNLGDGNYYLEVALPSGEYRTQHKFMVNKK